jgi:hypothetical protein
VAALPSFQTDMIELESPEQPTSKPVTKIEARKRIIHLQKKSGLPCECAHRLGFCQTVRSAGWPVL